MVKPIGSLNNTIQTQPAVVQKKEDEESKLLLEQREKAPLSTSIAIGMDKFQNALTVYPVKGLRGSKNSNFYEFLTMGMVPYSIGGATMMAVSNLATRFFKADEAKKASKLGRAMALGVIFYGVAKSLTKKLIETPLKLKYGIDMNLPYRNAISELPEPLNVKAGGMISHEYHKVFESVDFINWPLLYNAKYYGDKRNSYYDHIAKKMGLGENLKDSDQMVKPIIKDKVIKARTTSTFASYLWAAVGVGIATQKPWEIFGNKKNHPKFLTFQPFKLGKPEEMIGRMRQAFASLDKPTVVARRIFTAFTKSCKEFYQGGPDKAKVPGIAGKALLFSAVGMTLFGNLITLVDFKKIKANKAAAAPLIDESKAKVVC